jgi:hypothetical protein
VETALSLVAMVALLGVASSVAGRLVTRRKGALWVWNNLVIIGWSLIVVGGAMIGYAFLFDQPGLGISTKLGLGSMFMLGGLWMIW